jgi:RNA polymerase sigma factor (sigma-70 family)
MRKVAQITHRSAARMRLQGDSQRGSEATMRPKDQTPDRDEPAAALAAYFQEDGSSGQEPLSPPARSAEAEALERLADSDILSALRDLPEEFRVTIYLADIKGYRYKEIAAIMGTPVGTVMSRLHRGRGKLRERLAGYAPKRGTPGTAGVTAAVPGTA